MGPPFRFEAQYDESIVREAAWRFTRRRLGGRWWVWCLVLVASAAHLVLATISGWSLVTAIVTACWIVLIGVVLAGWLIHRRTGLRKLKALDGMRACFAFDEAGLAVTSRIGSTHLVWDAIDEAWIHDRFWIVTTAANAYFTLPVAGAPPEALDFARRKLGSRVS